jgi:hypothetical protein
MRTPTCRQYRISASHDRRSRARQARRTRGWEQRCARNAHQPLPSTRRAWSRSGEGAFADPSRIIAPLIMSHGVAFHTRYPHRSAGAEDGELEAEMGPTSTHHARGRQAIVAVKWESSQITLFPTDGSTSRRYASIPCQRLEAMSSCTPEISFPIRRVPPVRLWPPAGRRCQSPR